MPALPCQWRENISPNGLKLPEMFNKALPGESGKRHDVSSQFGNIPYYTAEICQLKEQRTNNPK